MFYAKSTVQCFISWMVPIVYATLVNYRSNMACTSAPLVSIPSTYWRLAVPLTQPCRPCKYFSHNLLRQMNRFMLYLLNGTHCLCILCKLPEQQSRQLSPKLVWRLETAVPYFGETGKIITIFHYLIGTLPTEIHLVFATDNQTQWTSK